MSMRGDLRRYVVNCLSGARSIGFWVQLIFSWLTSEMQVRDFVGAESRELDKFRAEWEERERQEEELFTRVPRTREERKREKHLKKSRNGYIWFDISFGFNLKFLSITTWIWYLQFIFIFNWSFSCYLRLAGLTEDFSDIKFLSTGDDADERTTGFRSSRNGIGNLKKRKVHLRFCLSIRSSHYVHHVVLITW